MRPTLNAVKEVQNLTARHQVLPDFEPLISGTLEALNHSFGPRLHSVYLYGSIAEGRARPGISDADFLVVLQEPVPNALETLEALSATLAHRFAQVITKVDLPCTHVAEVLDPLNRVDISAYLQILCLPLQGEDLRPRLKPVSPDWHMLKAWNGDLRLSIAEALEVLADPTRSQEEQLLAQRQIAGKTIRALFMVLAARHKIWQTDFQVQTRHVLRAFPSQRKCLKVLARGKQLKQTPAGFLAALRTFQQRFLPVFENHLPKDY